MQKENVMPKIELAASFLSLYQTMLTKCMCSQFNSHNQNVYLYVFIYHITHTEFSLSLYKQTLLLWALLCEYVCFDVLMGDPDCICVAAAVGVGTNKQMTGGFFYGNWIGISVRACLVSAVTMMRFWMKFVFNEFTWNIVLVWAVVA